MILCNGICSSNSIFPIPDIICLNYTLFSPFSYPFAPYHSPNTCSYSISWYFFLYLMKTGPIHFYSSLYWISANFPMVNYDHRRREWESRTIFCPYWSHSYASIWHFPWPISQDSAWWPYSSVWGIRSQPLILKFFPLIVWWNLKVERFVAWAPHSVLQLTWSSVRRFHNIAVISAQLSFISVPCSIFEDGWCATKALDCLIFMMLCGLMKIPDHQSGRWVWAYDSDGILSVMYASVLGNSDCLKLLESWGMICVKNIYNFCDFKYNLYLFYWRKIIL